VLRIRILSFPDSDPCFWYPKNKNYRLKNSKFEKSQKFFLVKECSLSLVRPFDFQALGEATSHPERISTYLHRQNMKLHVSFLLTNFVFLYLNPDPQTQINLDPGSQLWKNIQVHCFYVSSEIFNQQISPLPTIIVREKIMNALKQERSPQGEEGIVEKQVTWIVLVDFYFI